jgi:hypothetical protein
LTASLRRSRAVNGMASGPFFLEYGWDLEIHLSEGHNMKKVILVVAVIMAFATPSFAQSVGEKAGVILKW